MMYSREVYNAILKTEKMSGASGTFFSATNLKKDGSLRKWNCRLGVTKHLRGGEQAYDPEKFNFITVFCNKAQMYRQLNVNTLQYLKVCGKVLVEDGHPTDFYRRITS